jgi:peptidoglycan/LPS O-acetylase OafA/YrhL
MIEALTRNSRVQFADTRASVHFDLLRALAALLVVVTHGRKLLFVDFPHVASHRLLLSLPYLITNAGHQAVVMFFVLSGYFIGGAVFRATERKQWLWSDYLLRRLVRLWVVLIPALLVGLFWDKLGIALGHAPSLYRGEIDNDMLRVNVSGLLSPSVFLGNLFFLQTILVHAFGSNGALWSLAYEFWYYILFPLGFFAVRQSTPMRQRAICAVLFVAVAYFVGFWVRASFPIWLAGVALLLVPPPQFTEAGGRRMRILAAVLYAPLPLVLSRLRSVPMLVSDYVLTVATCGFLWVLLSAKQRYNARAVPVRLSRTLARFSYTLYAVHTPILVFLTGMIVGDSRWTPTPVHIAGGLALLGAVYLYAFGVAALTEFHTDRIRRRIERLLRLPSAASAPVSNPVSN